MYMYNFRTGQKKWWCKCTTCTLQFGFLGNIIPSFCKCESNFIFLSDSVVKYNTYRYQQAFHIVVGWCQGKYEYKSVVVSFQLCVRLSQCLILVIFLSLKKVGTRYYQVLRGARKILVGEEKNWSNRILFVYIILLPILDEVRR